MGDAKSEGQFLLPELNHSICVLTEKAALTLSRHTLWSFHDAVMNQYTPCHPLREDEK